MPRVYSLFTLAILSAGAATIRAEEKPLPAAPKGYTWERAKNAHAALLKPDGWHFASNELGHPLQYFVTKQPLARDAKPGTVPYETGVSVFVHRFPPPWNGREINASGVARQYVEMLKSRPGFEYEAFDVPKIAGLHGFGVRYRVTDATGSRRVASAHYANDATNALYSVSILSPLKTWDQDGPLMETVCKNVMVDPRFGGRNAADHERSGVEKAQRGDLDGAIADCSKAIELDPRYAPAYRNRANARGDKGDLEGAVADFDKAIELDPRLYLSYYGRGQVRRQKGDLEGSLIDLTKAIELNPKFTFAYNLRGAVRATRQDFAGAVADFSKSLELHPRAEDVLCLRAGAKYSQFDIPGAINDCDRAILINPNSVRALLIRAASRLELGDDVASRKDFNRCVELAPRSKAQVEQFRAAAVARRDKKAGTKPPK